MATFLHFLCRSCLRGILLLVAVCLFTSDPCFANLAPAGDRAEALVGIHSVSVVRAGDQPGGFSALFPEQGPRSIMKYSRRGGGVIMDPRGIIVTNAHLVQNAAGISVELFNGTRLEGRLIRVLPESDLAFVSVKPFRDLPFVPLADSSRMARGDVVYCIGRALNHHGVLMGGNITASFQLPMPRENPTEYLQIQFGFHLYGGDSGSPILDSRGHLLGIVSGGRRSGDKATIAVASNVIREAYEIIPRNSGHRRVIT